MIKVVHKSIPLGKAMDVLKCNPCGCPCFSPCFSANKLTRISWVIVTTGEPFDMKQAFKPAA